MDSYPAGKPHLFTADELDNPIFFKTALEITGMETFRFLDLLKSGKITGFHRLKEGLLSLGGRYWPIPPGEYKSKSKKMNLEELYFFRPEIDGLTQSERSCVRGPHLGDVKFDGRYTLGHGSANMRPPIKISSAKLQLLPR